MKATSKSELIARMVESMLIIAWDEGHQGCACDRPGAEPCTNPYRGGEDT